MRPNLTLKKEALTELTTEELGSVAGGWTPSCPLIMNITDLLRDVTALCDRRTH